MRKDIKRAAINGVVLWLLSLGCVIGVDYLPQIWHDGLLFIGGIFLGGVGAFIVVIIQLKGKTLEDET